MKQEIKERVEKIRNGEVPEGYKETKVGIVPNEWEEKMFNDIVFDFRGGAPLTPNDFKDNGIKVLPKGGVTRGGILVIEKDKMQYCSSQYTENHETNLVDNTYTIIVLRDLVPSGPNIGLMVKIDSNDNFILAQGVYGFKVKDELVSSHFLIHLSNGNGYRKLMNNIMVGSTQVHITNTTFLKLHIPLPSFPEQQKIAEILSTWDKAIELKEKLIEEKKEFKRGLMQKLLTGKTRFSEFTNKWVETDLNRIVEKINNKNDEKNQTIVTISAKKGFINQNEYFNKTVASQDLSNYYLIRKGDFAYNKSYSNGYPVGVIKRLESFEKAVVTTLYICFRIKDQTVSSNFLKYYFDSVLLNRQIKRIANEGGRAHGLLNVTPSDFFKIKIKIPDILEQEKIADVLMSQDKKIHLMELTLNRLKEQKRGLMQLLLTGIIRVEVD